MSNFFYVDYSKDVKQQCNLLRYTKNVFFCEKKITIDVVDGVGHFTVQLRVKYCFWALVCYTYWIIVRPLMVGSTIRTTVGHTTDLINTIIHHGRGETRLLCDWREMTSMTAPTRDRALGGCTVSRMRE